MTTRDGNFAEQLLSQINGAAAAAVGAETERCAQLCEACGSYQAAALIRNKGESDANDNQED